MTALQVLKKARAHLVRYGWKRYALGRRGQPCCALGAMCASAGYDTQAAAYNEAREALATVVGGNIVDFNDNPTTSKRALLRAFTRAIARLSRRRKRGGK